MANLPQFGIDLGGGLYLDSNGNVSTSAPADLPLYKAPGSGLPVNASAVVGALKQLNLDGVWKMLPSVGDLQDISALATLGLSEDLVNMLADVAQAAATICQFIPIIGFAASIIKAFGIFGNGANDGYMIDLINRRFEQLESREELRERINDVRAVATTIGQINYDLGVVRDYVKEIQSGAFVDWVQLQNRQQDVRTNANNIGAMVSGLASDPCNYQIQQDPYNGFNYYYCQNALYCIPEDGAPIRAQLPSADVATFDYRPSLAAIAQGIHDYLIAIKAEAAEYRTTSDRQQTLREALCKPVAAFVKSMRASSLARTIYQAGDVIWLQSAAPHNGGLFPQYTFPGIPVGAYDMLEYTESYLNAHADPANPDKKATMNMRWFAPPGTPLGTYYAPFGDQGGSWRWTLSAEEAEAANKQSEQDYVQLLISSGYMNMVQLLNLLRHLSTEPDRSETVKGEVSATRAPQASSSVTVTSKVALSDTITATATRVPQKHEALASISTQPIHRDVPVKYQIWLRTMMPDPNRHDGADYDRYYATTYQTDDSDPDFLKLAISAQQNWVLQEIQLYPGKNDTKGQPSPDPGQDGKGAVSAASPESGMKIKAVTYDYYVPVRYHFKPGDKARAGAVVRGAGLVGAGGMDIGNLISRGVSAAHPVAGSVNLEGGGGGSASGSGTIQPILGAGGQNEVIVLNKAPAGVAGFIGMEDATLPANAQKREFDPNAEVTLNYELSWYADQLSISFTNLPADRNYSFYVVVQELLRSGQWLHTPFRIDVIGQLTYVPQSFFDQEDAAKKWFAGVMSKVAGYARSKQPGPGDPGSGVIRPGDLVSVPSLETAVAIAEKHQPELLSKAIAEYKHEQQLAAQAAKAKTAGER